VPGTGSGACPSGCSIPSALYGTAISAVYEDSAIQPVCVVPSRKATLAPVLRTDGDAVVSEDHM
jgi:hypothetical protein